MAEFRIPLSRLGKISTDMVGEMRSGLTRNDPSSLLMLPTYIHRLPDGKQSGHFLALDFGGSTFRVIVVQLSSDSAPILKSQTLSMDNSMKSVSGTELFDHLASCVADFINKESLGEDEMKLGFTFSFPMKQSSLSYGTLVQWTKGFENPGVVGKDVAELLNDALKRNQVTRKVEVVAIANDTAGTLVAGALSYPSCRAGLILGTGTNAAYTEEVSSVEELEDCTEKMVVINMEWGNFGERGHLADLQTAHDKTIDITSNNVGKQLFEKMISGLYMGELVRLALLERVQSGGLSQDYNILHTDYSLDGAAVSSFISDADSVREHFPNSNEADVELVQEVCHSVSNRGAQLAAAGVNAIWLKQNRESFSVAVDGSVFLKHATFSQVMRETLKQLQCNVELVVASDGSGLGSALVAAIA